MRAVSAAALSLALLLASCVHTPTQSAQRPAEISIFAINDFHGHVQSREPVPLMLRSAESTSPRPAGGLAYLEALMKQLRARNPASLVVGMGDLIGATPADSALLHDEPAIEAMNRLGMSVSALGNHELDIGPEAFKALAAGACAPHCDTPMFKGAKFEYLAANVQDKRTQQSWLAPTAIRVVGGYRIGFIGAVTRTTPQIVRPSHTEHLQFEDEAVAINRSVPLLKAQGVDAIVVLIHEGGDLAGAAVSLDGDCPSLRGAITEILPQLDREIHVVLTGHTHQAYLCKIADRWVVQGGSYGAYISEVKLHADVRGKLLPSIALLHETAHDKLSPDAHGEHYVESVQQLTGPIKNQVLGYLAQPLTRAAIKDHGDSMLGKWVADAQLAYAQKRDTQIIAAIMNSGGIRTNIGEANAPGQRYAVSKGDVFAMQPFRNELIALTLTGAQLLQLLEQQADSRDPLRVRYLQPSSNVSYTWQSSATSGRRVSRLMINGVAVAVDQHYRIVVNNFIAEGGDGFTMLKLGIERANHGLDTDALTEYLGRGESDLSRLSTGVVQIVP